MKFELGKLYEFHGESRKVIAFDGADRPITEPSGEEAKPQDKPIKRTIK